MPLPRAGLTVAALLASFGCGNQQETAALDVRLMSPPVARTLLFPVVAPQEYWTVDYAVEIRETKCVAVSLTFVEIQVFEESFQINFGSFPHRYDQGSLARQGLSQLPACGSGLAFRGTLGNVGGLGEGGPKGPVRVMVRAIGVDEQGHGIGIDTSVESPLQVVR